MTEGDLRKELREDWDGWIDWREPVGNIGVGAPDCEILYGNSLIPIELKVIKSWRVHIQPSQIRWHIIFSSYGGLALFLIGQSTPSGNVYYLGKGKDVKRISKARYTDSLPFLTRSTPGCSSLSRFIRGYIDQ